MSWCINSLRALGGFIWILSRPNEFKWTKWVSCVVRSIPVIWLVGSYAGTDCISIQDTSLRFRTGDFYFIGLFGQWIDNEFLYRSASTRAFYICNLENTFLLLSMMLHISLSKRKEDGWESLMKIAATYIRPHITQKRPDQVTNATPWHFTVRTLVKSNHFRTRKPQNNIKHVPC